jgi:hypothetical protein
MEPPVDTKLPTGQVKPGSQGPLHSAVVNPGVAP